MGRVELVVRSDNDFVRLYARKRLLDAFEGDEALSTMFVDEARIAGMLRHQNVVSVLDVGPPGGRLSGLALIAHPGSGGNGPTSTWIVAWVGSRPSVNV